MAPENHAADERSALCELLSEIGPDQPTLCEGWQTRDLAAHLLVRERRPLAATGIVIKPVAGHLARVQRRYAERPFPQLIDALRRPPSWSPARLPAVDRAANTLEMYIHHEDVRRAQPAAAATRARLAMATRDRAHRGVVTRRVYGPRPRPV